MHAVLETYYKEGIVPSNETPEGVWALKLIATTNLPIPVVGSVSVRAGPVAERRFKFEHEGVWWRGSKDLVYVRDGQYTIRDHKSTSQLNPLWVKSEAQLLVDPQSVIYAFEAYLTDDPDDIENEWGYVTREKYPKTDLHKVRMTWDHTLEAMEYLTRVGKEMLRYYRERPGINDLPPVGVSNGGCEAFRGCKVMGCNVTALDRIKGQQLFNARKQGGSEMSYIEQMRARTAAQAALHPGTVSDAPPPAPAQDIRTRLAQATNVAPETFVPTSLGIKPSDVASNAPVAHAAQQAPAPVPTSTERKPRGRPRAQAPAPTPSAVQQVITTVGTEVGEAAAPKKVEDASEGVIGSTLQGRPVVPYEQVTTDRDGYLLCVNCAPMGVVFTLFSQYVRPVHESLKEIKGWEHYSIANFEGQAAFQDALLQYLQQSPPSGYLVVDSRTNEGRESLPTLERFAIGQPIRGF